MRQAVNKQCEIHSFYKHTVNTHTVLHVMGVTGTRKTTATTLPAMKHVRTSQGHHLASIHLRTPDQSTATHNSSSNGILPNLVYKDQFFSADS